MKSVRFGSGGICAFAMRTAMADGGARILLATDRYMSFAEIRNRPRTYDYPDTREKAIIFENYSTEPARLTNLRIER